jgi:hypothetical protein
MILVKVVQKQAAELFPYVGYVGGGGMISPGTQWACPVLYRDSRIFYSVHSCFKYANILKLNFILNCFLFIQQ